MKKVLTVALALSLCGCATLQTGAVKAGKYMCDNADILRSAYTAMLANAQVITDPAMRSFVEGGVRAAMAALDSCNNA